MYRSQKAEYRDSLAGTFTRTMASQLHSAAAKFEAAAGGSLLKLTASTLLLCLSIVVLCTMIKSFLAYHVSIIRCCMCGFLVLLSTNSKIRSTDARRTAYRLPSYQTIGLLVSIEYGSFGLPMPRAACCRSCAQSLKIMSPGICCRNICSSAHELFISWNPGIWRLSCPRTSLVGSFPLHAS